MIPQLIKVVLSLFLCLIFSAQISQADEEQLTLLYEFDTLRSLRLSTGTPPKFNNRKDEYLQRLQANGYSFDTEQGHTLEIRNDGVLITHDIETHTELMGIERSEFSLLTAHLYLNCSRTGSNGTTQTIRYFAKLPPLVSGRRFSQQIQFQLEPIYTSQDREALFPELKDHFTKQVSLTPHVDDSGDTLYMIVSLHSPKRTTPDLETEFSTRSMDLVNVSGMAIDHLDEVITMDWQCRIQHTPKPKLTPEQLTHVTTALNNSPQSTAHEDQQLKSFFQQAGADFTANPQSRLIFDGEQIIVRLPREQMTRVHALMANYNEVHQIRTTVETRHEQNNQSTALTNHVLCLSGKRASVSSIDPSLLGMQKIDPSYYSYSELSTTNNIDMNGHVIDSIFESRVGNCMNQTNVELSTELSLRAGRPHQAAIHSKQTKDSTESWSTIVTLEAPKLATPPATDLITEFIPITRGTVLKITGQRQGSYSGGPVDPFAPPSRNRNKSAEDELVLIDAFFAKEAKLPSHPDASLAFDGEQLIVQNTAEAIQRIQELVLQFEYAPPTQGCFQLSYENQNKETIHTSTSLTQLPGKRSSCVLRRDRTDDKGEALAASGVELTCTTSRDWATNQLTTHGVEYAFSPEESVNHWHAKIGNSKNKQTLKQHLPPTSESSWELSLSTDQTDEQ